jgi:hypothetical protein
MDEDKTSRTILLATSIVGGIGGLFTAINSLSETVRKTVGILGGFENWQLGVAALLLVALSWLLFRLSRRRRSVLLRPEALRLERANPAHLAGRAEDIEQLARLCREESLVFLEGESGCGKSALLLAGLAPTLRNDPELLPIYVESLVGSDWERDPRRFLAAALWSALDEAARRILEIGTVPGPDVARKVIETIPVKLGRTPLLLLDQFDDYQLRHRARFLRRRMWLKNANLAERNGFWRDIRELLASSTIHLVVVTRTDTAAGLTSVRFIDPETYRLDRLRPYVVDPLLTELVKEKDGQQVISDPEYSWTSLKVRISADLERDGTILPQQLKIVLAGLCTLPGRVLSVASYERAGRAAGIEARFIEDAITKAARLHGVTKERVRAALLTLVASEDGQNTVERPNDELLSLIDPAEPRRAQSAIDQLAKDEVIRQQADPETGEKSWLLDHDYLARAVREVDRRANLWHRTLADGAKALTNAGESWRRRWDALLPPKTQMFFFYDRLRGRFSYGRHRLYALKSLQRLGPYAAILVVVTALGLYEGERRSAERIRASADNILNGLEFPVNSFSKFSDVSVSDVEPLLRLASAEEPVRQLALKLLLIDPGRAHIFVRRPEVVLRAITGVSPRARALTAKFLTSTTASFSSQPPEILIGIADTAYLLGRAEAVPQEWLVAAIKGTTDPTALGHLGLVVGALPVGLTDSEAKDAIESYIVALKSAPSADQFLGAGVSASIPRSPSADKFLGAGLAALTSKLSDSQAKEQAELLLSAMKGITSFDVLQAMGQGLGALPVELTDTQANEVVGQFLGSIAMIPANAAMDLNASSAGVRAIADKLTSGQAKDALPRFFAVIQSPVQGARAQAVGWWLESLAARLTDGQGEDVLGSFLAAIESTEPMHKQPSGVGIPPTKEFILGALGIGLGSLPARLTDTQASDAIESYIATLKNFLPMAADVGEGFESAFRQTDREPGREDDTRLLHRHQGSQTPRGARGLRYGA